MFSTLSYCSSVFYKDFVNYTSKKLQALGLNYGSLFLSSMSAGILGVHRQSLQRLCRLTGDTRSAAL